MSRSGFQYALAALGAVAANFHKADPGVLRSIHSGLDAAAQTGRELSDLEQLALDNLMGHLVPAAEAEASHVEQAAVSGAETVAAEAEAHVGAVQPPAEQPVPPSQPTEVEHEPLFDSEAE